MESAICFYLGLFVVSRTWICGRIYLLPLRLGVEELKVSCDLEFKKVKDCEIMGKGANFNHHMRRTIETYCVVFFRLPIMIVMHHLLVKNVK